MAKKQKNETAELIPADKSPSWSVVTDDEGVHRLKYGKKIHERGTTPAALDRMRAIADWCNKRQLAPRAKNQCFADRESHPVKPLRKSERGEQKQPEEAPAGSDQ